MESWVSQLDRRPALGLVRRGVVRASMARYGEWGGPSSACDGAQVLGVGDGRGALDVVIVPARSRDCLCVWLLRMMLGVWVRR
jgi:hypothetical protein